MERKRNFTSGCAIRGAKTTVSTTHFQKHWPPDLAAFSFFARRGWRTGPAARPPSRRFCGPEWTRTMSGRSRTYESIAGIIEWNEGMREANLGTFVQCVGSADSWRFLSQNCFIPRGGLNLRLARFSSDPAAAAKVATPRHEPELLEQPFKHSAPMGTPNFTGAAPGACQHIVRSCIGQAAWKRAQMQCDKGGVA
jgi:hypothetical protein